MITHRPDCAMVTSHHLTCTCGALSEAVAAAKGRPVPPAWWRPKLVSAAEAEEQLAATEEFLNEIEAKRPTMNWDELVEEVEALRGDLD